MFILTVLAIVASVLSSTDASLTAKRDHALERINACVRRNEVRSRECKHLNQDVQTLVDVYRSGDKSVLPTLFRFTYLADFYDEALLSDPDGFLSAMAQLPAKNQASVAAGIAGGTPFGFLDAEKFKAVRNLLASVPESSPTKSVAELCLKVVETRNASLFVNYFPPQTFTGRSGKFQLAWYSSDMYRLREAPLWPPSLKNETYRLTYLGAFTGPKAVTLNVLPDGSGQIKLTVIHESPESPDQVSDDQTLTVSPDRVSEFLNRLAPAHFWEMATELPPRGEDGAEWILEGVQEGKYHIAIRWCPHLYDHSSEVAAFADAARFLFQLAGHTHRGAVDIALVIGDRSRYHK